MARPNAIFQSSSLRELNVEVEVDQFALATLMPLVSRQPGIDFADDFLLFLLR